MEFLVLCSSYDLRNINQTPGTDGCIYMGAQWKMKGTPDDDNCAHRKQ